MAQKAGFSDAEAQILAYSCQYVDNNLITYEISTPQGSYLTQPTQNFGFWDDRFALEVYIPFHFFPGDGDTLPSPRKDGKTQEFSVTPGSLGAKHVLITALKSRNLYQIGIALHTFADTWAHQNFTGLREIWNESEPNSAIPPVGHAQSLRNPDRFDQVWTDRRLISSLVSNRERFREAAKKIYRYLCTYQKKDFVDEDWILDEWENLFKTARAGDDTESRMADFIITCEMPHYNRKLWIEQAVVPGSVHWEDESLFKGFDKVMWLADELLYKKNFLKRDTLKGREDFYTTPYFHWQEASKVHRKTAQDWLDLHRQGWREKV